MFGGPSPLVVDPNANPTEQVLDEISAVLRKHGYVLGVTNQTAPFLLCKISDGVGGQAVAVAQIQQIAPNHVTWRPVTAGVKVSVQ